MRSYSATETEGVDRAEFLSPASLIMAMLDPSFYDRRRPAAVEHVETHISHLFFADDLVYKVKKPVCFSFLDYSTLAQRRYFLHEELRLNQRLAPSVYLGVLPISFGFDGWQLGGDVNPVEYTLVMRRLPARRMLDYLLERDQVTPQMMRSLAETLALFHARAQTGEKVDACGQPKYLRKLWRENLSDIGSFVGRLLDLQSFEAVRDFGEGFITKHKDLFERRIYEGRIREVHGDLHCEHICFAPEGIQIFDCIEFSQKLRCCDIASEIGFLIMDLEFRGAGVLAQEFLRRYLELVEDRELSLLLPFYKCHRALVRGKVEGLRPNGASGRASSYFEYASRVTWETFKPFLVMIYGLTGGGKSTLACELNRRLGLSIISSDATRKVLAGFSGRQDTLAYGAGIYSPSMTEKTYAKMTEETEKLILKGEGAILDATFQRRAHRKSILDLAAKHKVPVAMIHCRSTEKLIQKRLAKRAAEGRDLSDGRWEIYLLQKAAFDPIEEGHPEICLSVDTEASLSTQTKKVERFLRRLFLGTAAAS